MSRKTFWSLTLFFTFLMGSGLTATGAVHALFDLRTPATGPFPTDWFTVPDASHNTRRRVNLPRPDCAVRQSDCEDLDVINTLDGFNMQPRLSIPFDGPIDVTTVTSETVFLLSLDGRSCDGDDDCDDAGDDGGRIIGINQVVWDTATNTLHAESDQFLDQHARYAVIVTNRLRDVQGRPVEATEAFRRFRHDVRGEYKQALLDAIHAARRIGVRESEIVTASVFTTQTVTSILEKIRDQVKAATPEPADFNLGPDGQRTVFNRADITGIHWEQQTGDNPPSFTSNNVNVALLDIIPGAVGQVAFGKFNSPDYEVHPGEFIPPVGTRTGTPAVQGTNEVYFNLVLPSGTKPPNGWPVAIFGHGNSNNKNDGMTRVAGSMAHHGIATIFINAVGRGFGPLGTLTVSQTGGERVTFSAGGRGIDQDGDHVIEAAEGSLTAPPRTIILATDGARQAVADLMQLVRVIEVGVDVDGDGIPDLDPSRIYYFGISFGGNSGTIFLGVEPSVHAGVLTSTGAPIHERHLPPAARPELGRALASRMPSLINAPGITNLGGVTVGPPQFNDNFPLRDGIPLRVQLADGTSQDIQSPVTNTVAGAIAIQEVVENTNWVSHAGGDPAAFAPYLRKTPLPGVPAKSVIYQIAKTDQGSPNPNATAILRAGDLADRATFYRHDLAYGEDPRLPKDPHLFAGSINIAAFREIALGAQEQIAVFFDTDGEVIIHPEPARFFEVPIILPLPEDLNFIP